jgi:hypothetical protein
VISASFKQCCGSGIFIPDLGSRISDPGSRIPDPKTVTKERGEKKFVIILFLSHKFHKIEYYVIFEMLKKKIWANFQRIVEVFTQKFFNMLSNIWVWDPGSEIRGPGSGKNLFRIPDPKSRGQKGTGSRIPDHCFQTSESALSGRRRKVFQKVKLSVD